jgi:hypothetical protein
LKLEIIDFRAGPRNSPLVQMQGMLENIGSDRPMTLAGNFKADSRPWVENLVQRDAPDSPHFAGSILLTEGRNQVRIDRLNISTKEKGAKCSKNKFGGRRLIKNVQADNLTAAVNNFSKLILAQRTDFFKQSGFVDGCQLTDHDGTGLR